MERLSARKRSAIVGDYLSALSYSEIAARHHVSTGTVANVVADLKAGRFPEAGDIGEQIEQLKELSLDLKRANLTPGKCALGLMVLARINECGLEPADIDRWPLILKSVGNEDEAQEFIRMAYSIQEVQKRTGLSIDALHDEVHELEKKAAELEPISDKVADCKKQVAELTKQQRELSSEVANLEEKCKLLKPQVKDLEKREKDFSHRVAEMEPRAQKAETTLSTLSQEIQRLQDIGFSFEELAEFYQRVQVVARQHTIKPGELRARLLHELETLDKGLGLETLIKTKQIELNKVEQAVAETKKELGSTKAVVGSLKQEKTNLEASIKETRERASREIAKIIPVARDTVDQLTKELRSGVDKAIAEVGQLRDQALEAGKEVGRYEAILEANAWLKELLALVGGKQGIEAKQVRVIALLVARGVCGWLKVQDKYSAVFISLSFATNNLIKELEQWKV
jgi:predicted  nucleic acid-binding Zn-ribbon protein